ncbi:hypothetical protein D3C80_1708640 [compost metagenome]
MALNIAAQFHPGFLFGDTDIGIVTVAQHIDIEMLKLTGRLHRFVGCPQPGKYPFNVFVTDRHDQRGTVRWIDRLITFDSRRDAVFIFSNQQLQEPHQRRPEAGRDPAEQNGKQDQNTGLQKIR